MDYAKAIRELLGDTRAAKATKMGLTTPAYHGTVAPEFTEFKQGLREHAPIDAMAGIHFAADPQIAQNVIRLTQNDYTGPGRMISAMIPDVSTMQTVYARPGYTDGEDMQSHLLRAVFRTDPESLGRSIRQKSRDRLLYGRKPYGPEGERDILEALTAKDPSSLVVNEELHGQPHPLYAGRGYVAMAEAEPWHFAQDFLARKSLDSMRKQDVATAGVKALQAEGARGLIYRNTNRPEIAGAADPTSYIVFDPAHIRDQRAAFDLSQRRSRNLMYGLGAATVLGGLSGDTPADEEQY